MSKRVLVLGGTGFVGSRLCELLRGRGWAVHSLSRRGTSGNKLSSPREDDAPPIKWHKGNACEPGVITSLIRSQSPPFDAVVHAIGALFDSASGLGRLNYVVSAAGSVPDDGATYDAITRGSAMELLSAVEQVGGVPR